MADVTVYDKAWADGITSRIKQAVDDAGALILEAHTGRAWKLRGFGSWEAYVTAEFGVSRQHSYRLLDVARATDVAESVSPGRQIDRPPTTKEAPAVVRNPDVVRDAIASGAPASSAYQAAIDAQRSIPRPDPRPGGNRARGYQPPVDRARRMAEEMETWEGAIDPDAGVDPDFIRYIERIQRSALAILSLAQPS